MGPPLHDGMAIADSASQFIVTKNTLRRKESRAGSDEKAFKAGSA